MKKYKMKFLVLLGLLFSFYACQKRDIEVVPALLAPVTNLKYTLTGDTALLTWSLPTASDALTAIINDGASERQLTGNPNAYKFGIVETNKDYVFTVKVSDSKGNKSIGELVRFKREGAAPVRNLSAEQNDQGVLVKWNAPDIPVSKIQLKIGGQTADLGPNATSHQFINIPIGSYTISAVTSNSVNQVSNTVYHPIKVGATAIAYIGLYADSTTMLAAGDDDERAAARWLFKTYSNARYVSFGQIQSGSVDLSQFRVLWWNYDLETTNQLPATATDAIVVAKISEFYKTGGNLLFNQFAARYFWTLGRMSAAYPMVIGGGAGSSNGDTWGVGVNIGRKHDQSGHPLYSGITMTTQPDGRKTFPVLGPGHKEDHNTVIENIPGFLGLGPNDNEAAYNKFVTDNNLEWLGQWDGIGDYWMAGVMELKPKGDFQGSAIWMGLGSIEWNQNSGPNIYQATIERIYKNAIDYLKTK